MNEPLDDRTRQRPAHTARPALLRVFGNAGLLAFASLCVISLISGNIGAALMWGGALLVFFAPALDQTAVADVSRTGWLARQADALRWCGLALAAAGAALLLT